MVPYYDFKSKIYVSDFVEFIPDEYKDKFIEHWNATNTKTTDIGKQITKPIPSYVFYISDLRGEVSSELTTFCAKSYAAEVQEKISKGLASYHKNEHLTDHMLQICSILIENPDIDLIELAKTFKPEKEVSKKVKHPLNASPLTLDDITKQVEDLKSDITGKPSNTLISSFGVDIGHQLRSSNKAVTDWQMQNRFGLPISFQLHKRLHSIVSSFLDDAIPAEQRLSQLQKASKTIGKMMEQLPVDQKTIRQDLQDSEDAQEILRVNAVIAGQLCDAFNDVAPDLKKHIHKVGSEDKKTFNDSFIDTKSQEMRLLKYTYATKEVGYETIDMPALMSMSMNLNSMGITLDLIIDNIETAMREISANNMQAANKAIRKMNERVSKLNEVVEEAEQTIGLITDGTSKQLQITHQPLGENGDAKISVIRVSSKPS